jgi:hypothetical protein
VFELYRANKTAPPHISGAFPLDTVTVLPFAKACLRRYDIKPKSQKRDCQGYDQEGDWGSHSILTEPTHNRSDEIISSALGEPHCFFLFEGEPDRANVSFAISAGSPHLLDSVAVPPTIR